MNLKQRFKQALFSFFKEEIMKVFVPPNSAPHFTGEVFRAKDTTIDVELRRIGCVIDLGSEVNRGEIDPFVYERACDKMRKELFNEFIKWVQIDAQVLLDPQYYHKRRIVFNAWVGVPRK